MTRWGERESGHIQRMCLCMSGWTKQEIVNVDIKLQIKTDKSDQEQQSQDEETRKEKQPYNQRLSWSSKYVYL